MMNDQGTATELIIVNVGVLVMSGKVGAEWKDEDGHSSARNCT